MSRIKTFVNGGSLLPSDLDAIEDDYEVAFGTYKHLATINARLDAPSAGTYVLTGGYTGAGATGSSAGGALGAMWLDPSRYFNIAATSNVNPRTVYYSVTVAAISNNTAAGNVTLTTGLYQVSGAAGTGAAQAGVTLAGSPITGSTVAVSNPAASTVIAGSTSGDFAAPSAGVYALACQVSAAAAANSSVALLVRLAYRQV